MPVLIRKLVGRNGANMELNGANVERNGANPVDSSGGEVPGTPSDSSYLGAQRNFNPFSNSFSVGTPRNSSDTPPKTQQTLSHTSSKEWEKSDDSSLNSAPKTGKRESNFPSEPNFPSEAPVGTVRQGDARLRQGDSELRGGNAGSGGKNGTSKTPPPFPENSPAGRNLSPERKSTLKAVGLRKSFKKEVIIKGVSLEVSTGEIVGVLGPNGAGKTTTFYMICGLLQPDEGKVWLDQQDLTPLPLHKRARKGIGYLPQENSIFRELSVEENLEIIAEYHYRDRKRQRQVVELLLEQFNIEPIRHRKGSQLSGGERRRVEIARALVARPRFLFLDEPFAGIDPKHVSEIKGIIHFLKEQQLGVVITDHNVRETLSICDRAYVLRSGEILTAGTPEEIVNNPEVRRSYLGEEFQL